MVSSPTGKSVVVIGGSTMEWEVVDGTIQTPWQHWRFVPNDFSDALIELSGDSIGSLTWRILEQKLQCGRYEHLSFQIPHGGNRAILHYVRSEDLLYIQVTGHSPQLFDLWFDK